MKKVSQTGDNFIKKRGSRSFLRLTKNSQYFKEKNRGIPKRKLNIQN